MVRTSNSAVTLGQAVEKCEMIWKADEKVLNRLFNVFFTEICGFLL